MKTRLITSVMALLCGLMFGLASAQDKDASKAGKSSGGPSDPQIAGIVVAANQIDVDAGKLAKSRTKDKQVSAFAQQMITDHSASNKQAGALVKKLGVKPEESDTSRGLKSAAKQTMGKLKGLKGAEFDRAYVDNEVAYHQQVIDAVDKVLIPNAKNSELKDLLTKTRPVLAEHLAHAKQIQGSLGKK